MTSRVVVLGDDAEEALLIDGGQRPAAAGAAGGGAPSAAATAGGAVAPAPEVPALRRSCSSELLVSCPTCYDEFPASQMVALQCRHAFCRGCWREYLDLKVRAREPRRRARHHRTPLSPARATATTAARARPRRCRKGPPA